MLNEYLYQLSRDLESNNILLSFTGTFNQGIIEELGTAIRGYVTAPSNDKSLFTKVFVVFIEMTQNIKNYMKTVQDTRIENSGIVVIGKINDRFFIRSGNLLRTKDINQLETKLQSVIGLDKETLKLKYKEKIREEISPGSLGAGLGLIEMARKASLPVEYGFHTVDDNYSFYTLNVIL